jgi:hypothetical protein
LSPAEPAIENAGRQPRVDAKRNMSRDERLLGSAAALGAYFRLTRRNLFAGVLAGATAVWLLKWFAG